MLVPDKPLQPSLIFAVKDRSLTWSVVPEGACFIRVGYDITNDQKAFQGKHSILLHTLSITWPKKFYNIGP